jgi:hypothetical protein
LAHGLKIAITGKDRLGTDAPTVEDLLAQIRDFVSILRDVEGSIADGRDEEIEWRITDASKNSPLTIEITPFAKNYAVNIDKRAQEVVANTASGIAKLSQTGDRPIYFSDATIAKVESLLNRATDGLAETKIDTSSYDGVPPILISRETAKAAVANIERFRSPDPVPYRELGSVEGYIARVELDAYRRPVVWLRARIDDQMVKCISRANGLDRIGHYEVGEVLRGLRVQVFGLIKYRDLEKIVSVEVDHVHVFPSDNDLPDFPDIVAPDFTGGIEAVTYLRNLREDG